MSKYFKKFETQSAYEAAESSLILPNVSLTVDNNAVHYNPSSPVPPTPSHDYVEIGGVKWATMNVGANSITDYGLYFQWGDTQGYTAEQVGRGESQKYFGWPDYKYCNGTYSGMTKYNAKDNKTILEASDDAVQSAWGGSWRMPTTEEFQALGNAVNAVWTTNYNDSGINGLLCTDKTDSSKTLFFPSASFCAGAEIGSIGFSGHYWSSSRNSSSSNAFRAFALVFDDDEEHGRIWWNNNNNRSYGCTIRGVVG